ncbi:murein biosynthesis integral membrane protein MurJ [Phytohabitans sp. LJ34]|uniref:murein biosynthesis integral membrane protein MurJ n=1 Tax=Phytohabitans sp. LJ34 TaxID=3452217 RepID=UPI003F88936D
MAGAAALIAVLTVASRLAGFARTGVFTWVVGDTGLGGIYVVANTVPNIIFEIVAGGALASLVVPLLAGSVAAGDRATVSATTSALLTWTLTLLLPLAALVAVAAGPIMTVLGATGTDADAGARMLRVFAPQLPLYGIGIVLTGVLQAHRRFAWPVLAPLLSSVTVIGAYLLFGAVEGRRADLPEVGRGGELILSVGTTLGVVVLSLCLVIPVRRLGLRLRAGYRFGAEARRTVGGLALAGAATVGAQQVALLVTLWLALAGPTGTPVVYNLAQTIYLLPWAVLAVPLATAAYPTLVAAHAEGAQGRYRDTLAPTARGVLLLCCAGAAALVAVAGPVARFFDVPGAADGIAGFAPGLLGYGMFAVLTRALYARGEPRPAALATVAGWACAALAALALSAGLADDQRVLALTLGNSIGMAVLGALLVVAVLRGAGRHALAGLDRAAAAGLVAGGLAALAGWLVTRATGTPGASGAVLQGMLSGAVVGMVFLGVAYPLDRRDMRPMLTTITRRLGRVARGKGVDP